MTFWLFLPFISLQELLETDLGRSQMYVPSGGLRVCSLQELLRLTSHLWRLKNPVTHSSLSQIRNLCQRRTQFYILMEQRKVWTAFCNTCCLEWMYRICMLLTVIDHWIISWSWTAWKLNTRMLQLSTFWEPDTSKSPIVVCSLPSSSLVSFATPPAVCPCFIVDMCPFLPLSLPCSLRNWLCCW